MNPLHAVDIYIDLALSEAFVLRRRDLRWWHGATNARLLGSAVSAALDPKRPQCLAWQLNDSWERQSEDRQIVVAFRQNHQTIIATPFSPWGKAPNIILAASPRHGELGEAILTQANFSANAKGRGAYGLINHALHPPS